jgi:hypothetical protein
MALLRIKLDDEQYEVDLDRLSLGEARILKHEYGMTDLSEFNFFDPDQMFGLFAIAIRRKRPEATDAEITAEVEGIDIVPVIDDLRQQIEDAADKAKAEDPTPAVTASEAGGSAPSSDGAPETLPATAGSQS